MALTPGTTIGSYEISALIGKGGMGEVYRATDTKLKRDVAIKVLPDALAGDAARLARFQREAEVLASLNHPNIAVIHGLEDAAGSKALVMELVEGPTLAERLQASGSGLPVDEALEIAKQIAEALEAAHEQGIIHRDLKPANVKVKEGGTVKVLDFGLAKAIEPAGIMSPGLSQSPTITTPAMTQAGLILGTAAYMSPEQARGKPVDRRTDIWAFGCVLYEMLTGRRAFDGEDTVDVLGAVARVEPDWTALPGDVPAGVSQTVRLCLRKQPKERLPDVGTVRLALEGAFDYSADAVQGSVPEAFRPTGQLVAAVLAATLITGLAVWGVMRSTPPGDVTRFVIPLPENETLVAAPGNAVAVSPDGRRVVYFADGQLQLRHLDRLDSIPIPGTEAALSPLFSPDGEWIAFHQGQQLRKVPVSGGASTELADGLSYLLGGTWLPDGTILASDSELGIFTVPDTGGTPTVVVPFDFLSDGLARSPQLLPDGKTLLYTLLPPGGVDVNRSQVVVHSPENGMRRVVVPTGRDARYLPTGHLVYAQGQTLYAIPFDLGLLEASGGAVPVVDNVAPELLSGASQFAISPSGTLAYGTGLPVGAANMLVWVERDGRETSLDVEARAFEYPRLSPDGRYLAVTIRDDDVDIWLHELDGGRLSRLSFDKTENESPVWLDNRRLAYTGARDGAPVTLVRPADGSGREEVVAVGPVTHHHLSGWSPITQTLAFSADWNVWSVVVGDAPEPRPLLDTDVIEQAATFSPDGRWLAYAAFDGSRSEVFVESVPRGDGRWQVSTGGGSEPWWSADGRELFYRSRTHMMAVPVQTDPLFQPSPPQALFEDRYLRLAWRERNYDVTRDGQRFLVVRGAGFGQTSEVVVVLNFFKELTRLVPTD